MRGGYKYVLISQGLYIWTFEELISLQIWTWASAMDLWLIWRMGHTRSPVWTTGSGFLLYTAINIKNLKIP